MEEFLRATAAEQPLDLIGYSMGGGTAYEFAARHVARVHSLSLLAPGLLIAPDQYETTIDVLRSGLVERCVYNYRTEEQAKEMMRLVGYAEPAVSFLGRVLSAVRQAHHPPDYWWKMWAAFGCVEASDDPASAVMKQSERLHADGLVLRAAKLPVFVVQGSEERVIHSAVPSLIKDAVGESCETKLLDGFGHRGHPTDPKQDFLKAAGKEVGAFLARIA